MAQALVTNAFGPYQRGDVISDPRDLDAVRRSSNAVNIVMTQLDEPPPSVAQPSAVPSK